jgi:hypothetical protein
MDKEDSKEERLARRTKEEQEAKMRARDDGSHRSSRFDRSCNKSSMSSDVRRSRTSQRVEEDQEVKRRAKESMRSPRSTKSNGPDSKNLDARRSRTSQRAEEEQEVKRRARDSMSNSKYARQLLEEQVSASMKSDFSRKLGTENYVTENYVIGNGLVIVECDTDDTCEDASKQPWYRQVASEFRGARTAVEE